MVKRYVSLAGGPLAESLHGKWVSHEDYAALAERCERLEAALRNILGEHANDNYRPKVFYIAANAIREIDS